MARHFSKQLWRLKVALQQESQPRAQQRAHKGELDKVRPRQLEGCTGMAKVRQNDYGNRRSDEDRCSHRQSRKLDVNDLDLCLILATWQGSKMAKGNIVARRNGRIFGATKV